MNIILEEAELYKFYFDHFHLIFKLSKIIKFGSY